ncbi:MAG TPA: L,D-transpeptidase [Solirubrobacteraceae bacterium]|nr:L,D-transpeptidase [Solirubrobacteraceae bacterium]
MPRRSIAPVTVLRSLLLLCGVLGAGPIVLPAAAQAARARIRSAHVRAAPSPAAPSAAAPSASTPSAAAPVAAAPVAPVRARVHLSDVFRVGSSLVTVPGRAVGVRGFVWPYASGQTVELEATLDHRIIAERVVRVRPWRGGALGTFSASFSARAPGTLRIKCAHAEDAAMGAFVVERGIAVLAERLHPGSEGRLVVLMQRRLRMLHIYLRQTGVLDAGMRLALDAYHRLLGWGEGDTSADARTITALLDGRGRFAVRYPGQGRHAEGDLTHQLLALVQGGRVQAIYPISSGKPSTPTILGSFRIYDRVPGYLPDGMYYSDFFIRGYAIHGYDPAPDYPASHGCMRLAIADAVSVYNWLAIGDWVDTYYR